MKCRRTGKMEGIWVACSHRDGQDLDLHHLPESVALHHLPHVWAHRSKLRVGRDDLVDERRVRHEAGHLLQKLRVIEHSLHLYGEGKARSVPTDKSQVARRIRVPQSVVQRSLTMFGSFAFSPMSANGLKPASTPWPMGPLSTVSGSVGFCPACIDGRR